MAKELMKQGGGKLAAKGPGAMVKHAKKAAKKHAKKAAKQAGEKTAKRKHDGAHDGVRTAFHHMQRAAVVISLMEKGTGEDLRELLQRGVTLYEQAVQGKGGNATILKAIGVLRATEHLALAGLYDARKKHRQRVEAPSGAWLSDFVEEAEMRLQRVEDSERGAGLDLYPVAEELLHQAREADNPHLGYEFAMAGDALCFALENGL